MKFLYLFVLIATISLSSCSEDDQKDNSANASNIDSVASQSDLNQTFIIDRTTLTKDYTKWYAYTYQNVRLSQDFIGLDFDSTKIDKAAFLNKLMTKNVVTFKTKILQGQPVYQLFKLDSADDDIRSTTRQMAATALAHFKMEGTEIPEFDFTDLNGIRYNKSSAKGKIIVLKCWFIRCVACVKEFPELNKLVDQNSDRDDILFISLATDSKQDLVKFLATKEFKYATVPRMSNYMDKLHVTAFPTHFLIDKDGKIIKVVNDISELEPFLKKLSVKTG